MAECIYLSHIVSRGVVQPEISKVEVIQGFGQPTTKKQGRAFLVTTENLSQHWQNPLHI